MHGLVSNPRSVSTERQFLTDFVSGGENTAGGRLARWLAPTSIVEPAKCELKPPSTPARPGTRVTLPIIVKDQYGDVVASPALKVEVVVQRLEENAPHSTRAFVDEYFTEDVPDVSYQPTVRDTMSFQAITMMKAYHNYSFEELRLASGTWGNIGSGASAFSNNIMPAERLQVRTQPDGSYVAIWTPRTPGTFNFRCTLDDHAIPQDLTIDVAENPREGAAESAVQAGGLLAPSPPAKLRRFCSKFTAGLRVRASPSLQAEQIGKVPPGANLAFTEELTNKDGSWVRLSSESVSAYSEGCSDVAWCLQHHRHLDRVLLIPIEENSPVEPEYPGLVGEDDVQGSVQSWGLTDAIEFEPTDITCADDRKFPFSIQLDVADDSDSSSSPFVFGLEPSKRSRIIRNELCSTSTKRMQRRSNGNSDEWWSPVKQRSSDNGRDGNAIMETDIESEPAQRQEQQPELQPEEVEAKETRTGSRLAQIGTQTSPESLPGDLNPVQVFLGAAAKEGRLSPKTLARERLASRSRAYKRASSPPPPPLPARIAPAPPLPKKHALSPAQAESLRAIFGALLWHEGIVHDAITCAAFLKFHPELPKYGTRVVTRPPHDTKSPRHQRHSVEVSNAGNYLRIQPSNLEALTRSGEEACASRERKVDLDMTIREEDAQGAEATPSVVNVLPPALRALVALWDTLYDADQLTAATDKLRMDITERNENDDSRSLRKKRDWKSISSYKSPYSVRCELCGGVNVPPPLAAHMRHAHPGCRSPTNRGYDRAGVYKRADSPAPADSPASACGQLAQAYQLWYIYCEKCREKALKAASVNKQLKTKTISELPERVEFMPDVDHHTMKENALFLLDLATLTNSEPMSSSPLQDTASRSPPTPPGSLWRPAPPFQVYPALGAAPNIYTVADEARYHSLGRQPPTPFVPAGLLFGTPQPLPGMQLPRVHRSVSMGQAGARDLASAVCPPLTRNSQPEPHETLPGAGSSLLAQPSAALQRLVGCGSWNNAGCVSAFEAPQVDPDTLIKSPVLSFVLARRDLLAHRQKMDAAVRINKVREYAFEALNWLLRSTSQPVCVHDIMWWFCTALDKYARIVPPPLILEDNKEENFVWECPDVTGWCDVTVSSRQGMAGALTDGSTETFWESGDEDRNKAKWIQVAFPGGTPDDDRPHIVCVHIDNTRDTANKTLLVSFLYSAGSTDMFHMQDIEVDPKSATWVCYTLPRLSRSSIRIRCEMRGPEPAVRVRQVRVLSAPTSCLQPAFTPASVMHTLTETDTLRVFRLLTSQVFGKLLEWNRSGSESGAEGAAAVVEDGATADDSDLREHVVGILFAGHKLTSLQRQVMSHIVSAIGCEAARVRDDWETALLCAEAAERTGDSLGDEQLLRPQAHQQDNYCFEMLSLLLALSGSAVGRAHLAQRPELLNDLLALLHTGSERVQRQVISLLRRMIQEITPQKMLAAVNLNNELGGRATLMDYLVSYLAKAITVQVKIKGSGTTQPWSVTMGAGVAPAPPATWFMRGETTKQHADLVAKLLTDMAEEKISHAWGVECRTALANYVVQVSQITELDRRPHNCIAAPIIWMALAALCVCEQSHIELAHELNGDGPQTRRDEDDCRPFCVNHDDGATVAVIDCRSCGPLCTECDRFLHLNRHTRTHQRQVCKEEESAIRIDIHEGCGRAKLFWLLLLIDRRTLKALAEFRGMENGVCDGNAGGEGPADNDAPGLAGTCRFCGTRGNAGLLAIGNVCADQQCQEHGRDACNRVLGCSHLCGGVRGERTCLPCLFGCASGTESAVPLRQDADDMCMICFTDPLQASPAIQLKCGHVFHLHCCKKVLANKWIGPRITFSFSQCPICKADMAHWTLDELLAPIRRLKEEVQRKAVMRLEYEGVAAPGVARGRALSDPANYAMDRYAYYVCHKCGKAYFGGHARCEAETTSSWEPTELVCGACSDVAGARTCPKHGADFLEYKCRYCCSVAVFFCFGTSHFCNSCHDDFQRVTSMPKHTLPQCPAGPKGEQLPGSMEQCPLHVQHPPTGEEFALGCGVCRNAHAF
ncbi:hypothetical protein K1T71_000091 [Dendrolimus kikuchii]|uniref:Uncharacterized protein n=1 Tax=Dendrolimus kikuchii TaxID=765133 RepID=A0ACC1DI94_9NEOP|nr:hypothetical protein K1T71_000091 [Dendrolimus kikuchii]